jgi:hypothetical protein
MNPTNARTILNPRVRVLPELLAAHVAELFRGSQQTCRQSVSIEEINAGCFLLKMAGKGKLLLRVCMVRYVQAPGNGTAVWNGDGLKELVQCVTVIPENYYLVDAIINPDGRVADYELYKYNAR